MKEIIYFGTYTRRTSQGIYKADFDTETGKLSNLELFASEPSPTYLAFDQHQHLYTVGSHDSISILSEAMMTKVESQHTKLMVPF